MQTQTLTNPAYIASDSFGPVTKEATIGPLADLVKGTVLGRINASGAADLDEANKLHDADGGFSADMVGATVYNLTDGTSGKVTAYVDSGELTLDSDVFPDGDEDYVIIGDLVAHGRAKTNGAQVPMGILAEDAAAASAAVQAVVWFAGVFVEANMAGLDASAKLLLEARGIHFV